MPKILSALAACMAGLMLFAGPAVSLAGDTSGVTRIQTKSPGQKSKVKKARVKSGQG